MINKLRGFNCLALLTNKLDNMIANNFSFVYLEAENPRIKLTLDKGTDYHVGENIRISADIKNKSDVLCLTWRKETPNGDKTLDITLPKYQGTKVIPDETILCINHCEETDMGSYYLLTACSNDTEIHSNKTQVIIQKGNLKHFIYIFLIYIIKITVFIILLRVNVYCYFYGLVFRRKCLLRKGIKLLFIFFLISFSVRLISYRWQMNDLEILFDHVKIVNELENLILVHVHVRSRHIPCFQILGKNFCLFT